MLEKNGDGLCHDPRVKTQNPVGASLLAPTGYLHVCDGVRTALMQIGAGAWLAWPTPGHACGDGPAIVALLFLLPLLFCERRIGVGKVIAKERLGDIYRG